MYKLHVMTKKLCNVDANFYKYSTSLKKPLEPKYYVLLMQVLFIFFKNN